MRSGNARNRYRRRRWILCSLVPALFIAATMTSYAHDVEQLIEGLGYFDVYLGEDRLTYVTRNCGQVDLAAPFFLHVIPAHQDDLPEHRKQHGFDNLKFRFSRVQRVIDGEVCAVTRELPKYDIAMIRTGQFTGEGRVWEVEFSWSNVEVERLIEGLEILRVESSLSNVEFDMSNIQSVTFQETPNLYFISFDALAPRALLRNYLGIENTRFHDLFDDEFRRFPNFFVNAVLTIQSINMLMSLDEDLFFSMRSSLRKNASMFSGSLPSPLLRILSENGYETSALYNDMYLGYPKGPHIDNYFVNRVGTIDIDFDFDADGVRQGGVCTVTRELPDYDIAEIRTGQYIPGEDAIWTVKFFPARLKGDPVVVRSDFDVYLDQGRLVYVKSPCEQEDVAPRFFLQVIPKELHQGEFLLDKLTKLGSDRPQFLIAHLYMPGHTAPYFRYDDQDHLDQFKSSYTRESNSAARYLEDIVAHLKHHDPNAILLVYGDHGPLVSQGMEFDEAPEMVVQDRFGVLGGVYPRDRCSTYIDAAEEQGYLTVLDAVHAILGCLSGGQSVLVRPRENRLGGFGGVPLDSGYTYEDFLYE